MTHADQTASRLSDKGFATHVEGAQVIAYLGSRPVFKNDILLADASIPTSAISTTTHEGRTAQVISH